MVAVGADGNNAPEFIEEIPADLWYGIQARAWTYRGGEPFRPDFGIGLIDGIATPNIPARVWRDRLQKSFGSLVEYEGYNFNVRVDGSTIRLEVSIRDD